ncbi:MAG: ADP-ribosylglycohydrolase family protein [Desulfobacterales bacterium]|jgi:hypothetical protein|nr:ADP-ribosylglycohydrolase family protein [Desulfobacterales bacterium]
METNAKSESRRSGALWGLYIGDALAMPVHWYYNRSALFDDYGRVADYMAPKHPHPDSILFRSSYTPPDARGEILHDQARYWGEPGIHLEGFPRRWVEGLFEPPPVAALKVGGSALP